MFDKVLIVDRGETAIRIARTCERLGAATVALHGPDEADRPHVTSCDEAVALESGPTSTGPGFIEGVLDAARRTGARAIHPGHGPAGERADFARAVAEADRVFIGPDADAIERLGTRSSSRELALMSGVRPVYQAAGPSAALSELHDQAHDLGFPVLVRAAGDPRGPSAPARDEEELGAAVERCRAALGDPDAPVHLEAFVARPRIFEVELLADGHDHCVALGERECSIWHEGHKILTESPSPALVSSQGEFKRRVLANAATRVAVEGGLEGAGSARFLMDAAGQFHFTAFRPCLSGDHALEEVCTGLDLVEWQLRIAAGEPLPQEVINAQGSGHALLARIRATGEGEANSIEALHWPTVAPGALRIETEVQPGRALSLGPHDVVAKVVTYAPTRHQALLTLDRVLAETTIAPLNTNLDLLRRVLADEAFRAGQYDADFTERLLSE